MNIKSKLAAAVFALSSAGMASAADIQMYIDVSAVQGGLIGSGSTAGTPFGNPGNLGIFSPDVDTITGTFTEFGFNQFLATSLYEKSGPGGSFTGVIRDTNSNAFLTGSTPSITPPIFAQVTLGDLAPLTPPQIPLSATEGFGTTWGLTADYDLYGNIPTDGTNFTGLPSFDSGTYDVWFDDYSNNTGANDGTNRDIKVLSLTLISSLILPGDVILTFKIAAAQAGFLFLDGVDAANQIGSLFRLDTNIDTPIPSPGDLVEVLGADNKYYGYRQTRLDGSVAPGVPEPAS